MANLSEITGSFLSWVARLLGLKPSEAQRLEQLRDRLSAAKSRNADQLEDIKLEIKTLESRALKKKKELDEARGDSKRIITGEIERTFRELDRLRGKENIYARNVDHIMLALAKIDEVAAAGLQGMSEDEFDRITAQAEEAFAELKVTDRAARQLEEVQYHPGESSRVDVEQRLGEVEGTRQAEPKLSPEVQKRLKELEEE